jgi:hypothetical protein
MSYIHGHKHCSETASVYAVEGERPGFTPTQESEKISEINSQA